MKTRSRTTIYTPEDVYNFARDGNVDELIIALNQGNNSANWYRSGNGHTALHYAAYNGSINIVEILLDRGIDINSKTNDGNTALHWATRTDHMNIIKNIGNIIITITITMTNTITIIIYLFILLLFYSI